MSLDALVLETCVVRVEEGNECVGEEIWKEIDEQRIPASLRSLLEANGLRAGVCPVAIPPPVSRVIDENTPGKIGPSILNLTPELGRPTVDSWHRQVRAGRPVELLESDRHDQAHLLISSREGGLSGRRLSDARFLLRLSASENKAGAALLDIVPVVKYGAPVARIVARDNVLWPEHGQPEIIFDELRVALPLSPGETLVVAGQARKRKSIGGFLFREETGNRNYQKLLLVRLAQTQQDGGFQYDAPADGAVEWDLDGPSAPPGGGPHDAPAGGQET